ncbi:MAG: DUF2341 domain-containing protein [Methanosarcinales archaeon]
MFYNPSQCLKDSFFELKGVVKVRPPQGFKSTGPWLSGWNYRRPVTVTEQSGSDLSNYQVLIELDSTNFDFTKAQTNGEDIRFTIDDAETLIDHWIENWDSVGETAKVWVEVPTLTASTDTTIYMYYGNISALNVSDGDATFEFFDDFDGTNLDTNKWDINAVGNITYSVFDSKIRITDAFSGGSSDYWIYDNTDSGNQHQSKWTLINSFILEWKQKVDDTVGDMMGQVGMGLVGNDNLFSAYSCVSDPSGGTISFFKRNTYNFVESNTAPSANATLPDLREFRITKNGNNIIIRDLTDELDIVSGSSTDVIKIVIGPYGNYPFFDYGDIFWVITRGYSDPEPSITIGSEETS